VLPFTLELGGYRQRDESDPRLGLRRARAVRRELVARGIPPEQLRVTDHADLRPLCPERSASCAWTNRRVDFHSSACAATLAH
jgi:outer membrane protein OmpA-like peptidoglycan-associated protein